MRGKTERQQKKNKNPKLSNVARDYPPAALYKGWTARGVCECVRSTTIVLRVSEREWRVWRRRRRAHARWQTHDTVSGRRLNGAAAAVAAAVNGVAPLRAARQRAGPPIGARVDVARADQWPRPRPPRPRPDLGRRRRRGNVCGVVLWVCVRACFFFLPIFIFIETHANVNRVHTPRHRHGRAVAIVANK